MQMRFPIALSPIEH